jgi:hypothetical protein
MRAMANNCTDAELLLLHRLKEEKAAILNRYTNLNEAFKSILGIPSMRLNSAPCLVASN